MKSDESAPARPRPVFARHAASLIVVRDSSAGPEVLMGMRGAGHRFMPNRLVFPGGAVDPADARAPAASELSGHAMAMLGRNAGPRLARALAIAAARELNEETGLSLGTPPRLHTLSYLCRAVTPPASPIRFNARFLVVDAAHVTGALSDTHELHQLGWRRVGAALQDGLMLVTREVLERLAAWLSLPEAARADRTTLDVFRQRRWRTE